MDMMVMMVTIVIIVMMVMMVMMVLMVMMVRVIMVVMMVMIGLEQNGGPKIFCLNFYQPTFVLEQNISFPRIVQAIFFGPKILKDQSDQNNIQTKKCKKKSNQNFFGPKNKIFIRHNFFPDQNIFPENIIHKINFRQSFICQAAKNYWSLSGVKKLFMGVSIFNQGKKN